METLFIGVVKGGLLYTVDNNDNVTLRVNKGEGVGMSSLGISSYMRCGLGSKGSVN